MVACPYFVVFELLGPAIELIGYVVVPLAWSLGILSPVFLLAFVTVAILLGVLLSIAALASRSSRSAGTRAGATSCGCSSGRSSRTSATGS
jgi:hypothetical protein